MITTKNKFGLLHSYNDQPSIIDNGDLYWYINGEPNRSDISFPYIEKSNGEKYYRLEDGGYKVISHLKEEWFDKNGRLHREDGPARICYYKNGNIKDESYFLNGNYHRENGPARICYYKNGNIKFKHYYLNDKNYIEKMVLLV
jgi:hypothetical protein